MHQNKGIWSEAPEFDSRAKRYLLGFVERPVRIAGQDMRLHAAVDASVASYVRILDGKGKKLALPDGLVITEDDGTWVSTDGV